jgi:RecB family exonuclease
MTAKKEIKLSASRLNTAKKCSFSYYANYIMKLPQKKNDGASRGDICHCVFECLGKKRHKKTFNKILEEKNAFSVPSVERLVMKKAIGHNVQDKENLRQINEMIVAGLEYDFFGHGLGKPTEAYSEYEFDFTIEKGDKYYKIKGFIDKLFLYKRKKLIVIRDFKTSKKVFEGNELDENYQDYIYSLAARHAFPEYNNRESEFVFLKFDLKSGKDSKGLLKMERIKDEDLDNFEDFLVKCQSYLENFSIEDAKNDYAADKKVTKEDGFAGIIVCGFAKYAGEPKKNGDPKWHCPYKFPFDYYGLYNEKGNLLKTAFVKDYYELAMSKKKGYSIKKMNYEGCPRWNRTSY